MFSGREIGKLTAFFVDKTGMERTIIAENEHRLNFIHIEIER